MMMMLMMQSMQYKWVSVWSVLLVLTLSLGGTVGKNLVVETTQHSSSITCWTCPNKTSNGECNDWAPEIRCPTDESICRTVHQFERESGESVLVHKECVAPALCRRQHVGCWENSDSPITECVSCCTSSYCNEDVAVDNNTALQLSVSLLASAASQPTSLPAHLAALFFFSLFVT